MHGLQRLRLPTPAANACTQQHHVAWGRPCSLDARSRRSTACSFSLKQWFEHRLSGGSAVAEPPPASSDSVAVAHPTLPAPDTGRCSNNFTSFTEEFRIRGYEAGPDHKANIITIANLLQEVACNHGVATWGRSESGLANLPGLEHLVFVSTRMQIRMDAYPKWGDIVRLETYYAEDGRVMVRRDWTICDASTGQQLGASTSSWVTINTTTRRLGKLPEDVRTKFLNFAPNPPRHVLPVPETKKKLPEFTLPASFEGPQQVARRTDMDANGHINNVTYLAWAMETVPADVWSGAWQLTELEIDFKAECLQGDTVQCYGEELVDPAVAATNGSASSNGNGASASSAEEHAAGAYSNGTSSNGTVAPRRRQFLHSLRKLDGREVWLARTTWTAQH